MINLLFKFAPFLESSIDKESSDTEDLLNEVQKVGDSMEMLKRSLLEQQNFVKRLIEETQIVEQIDEKISTKEEFKEDDEITPNNSLNSTNLPDPIGPKPQICPMCEAHFPVISNTHEDFVNHVNSHFTFEEGDTLQNFEIVNETENDMVA